MKISVINLGPITKAEIDLSANFTVFIGKNGSGKSYLGKVIYGLESPTVLRESYFNNKDQFIDLFFEKNIDKKIDTAEITDEIISKKLLELLNLHARLFSEKLSKYFNDDSDLFKHTKIEYLEINHISKNEIERIIKTVSYVGSGFNVDPEMQLFILILKIFSSIFKWTSQESSHYLPAGRSSFMMTYKDLYKSRAENFVNIESLGSDFLIGKKSSGFDKPTEEFISKLYNLKPMSSDINETNIAEKLQSALFEKDNLLIIQPEGGLADFKYHINDTDHKINLHLASSMVTEISPIIIGFKHWIKPGSLLVIDEPESHLHPEAQQALIQVLADAVNQDIRIIIMTHSPYILSCINNIIKLQKIKSSFSATPELEDFLQKNNDITVLNEDKKVAAYHFVKNNEVTSLIEQKNGLIDESEFTEPFNKINAIYETLRDIEWDNR